MRANREDGVGRAVHRDVLGRPRGGRGRRRGREADGVGRPRRRRRRRRKRRRRGGPAVTTRENRRIAFGGGRRRVGDRSSVACEYSLLQCLMYTSHDVTYDMIRSASRLFLQVRERPFLYPLFVIRKVRVRRGFVHQRAEIVQRVDVVVQVVDVVRDVPELRVHLLQAPLEHLAHAVHGEADLLVIEERPRRLRPRGLDEDDRVPVVRLCHRERRGI
mmetsp:Transcript_6697/g.24689  ORF Transcript_6697/g.24689 Transcript_6697/m.24689 type:complete len:217 (+) Transcript_6697:1353-2003(+)